MKEERFSYPEKPQHWWGDHLGQKGSFRGLEGSVEAGLQQAEQRETCTEDPCYLAAVPSPRHGPASNTCEGRLLKLGLQRTDLGRGLGLALRKQPEGPGVW